MGSEGQQNFITRSQGLLYIYLQGIYVYMPWNSALFSPPFPTNLLFQVIMQFLCGQISHPISSLTFFWQAKFRACDCRFPLPSEAMCIQHFQQQIIDWDHIFALHAQKMFHAFVTANKKEKKAVSVPLWAAQRGVRAELPAWGSAGSEFHLHGSSGMPPKLEDAFSRALPTVPSTEVVRWNG